MWHRRQTLIAILLFVLVLGVYLPCLDNDFVNFDDTGYVTTNLRVQRDLTWAGVKWAFSNADTSNWHPVTWLTHMLDCQLYGLKPRGHHFTNLLLHAANTALLFLVLRRITGATGRSLFVAALFGLHPVHVESVAWVSERKDVLSTWFWLLTMWAYAGYVEGSKGRAEDSRFQPRWVSKVFYALALVFFALGLMSKSMLVTLPCVLLLLDYWPLKRSAESGTGEVANRALPWARLVLEKTPFFLLTIIISVVTFIAQKNSGAMTSGLALDARVENALVAFFRYLGKLFWPARLAVFYPLPDAWPMWAVVLAGLALLGISAGVFLMRRERPWLLVGWLWYVGTLIPVIGFVQVGGQSMADRYTYIPSIGFLIVIAWGAYELTDNRRWRAVALPAAAVALAVLCVLVTRRQIAHWKNGETLFLHTLSITENNFMAYANLGHYAMHQPGRLDEAIDYFRKSLKLKPDYPEAHSLLGQALGRKGLLDEAISELATAIRLKPRYAAAYHNLAFALQSQGRVDEALGIYQEVLRLEPDSPVTYGNIGDILAQQGRFEEAAVQYEQCLRLDPNAANAFVTHFHFGMVLAQLNRRDEAIKHLQQALKLHPNFPEVEQQLRALNGSSQPDSKPQ